jgi:glycosyltransferase involved in cell wall biosynthesis
MPPTISAVINTYNEEGNIASCLEAVRWCDEIIVVDMESDDRTVEIAGGYTDKIYSHKKVLAFDIARKFAVEKAGGEWILLVDADELVPRSLAETLQRIAQEDRADIVAFPFKTYMLGAWIRHTGWWPEYHPRFFRRGALTFSGTVHAYLSETPGARKLTLPATEEHAIVHFAYRDSEHFVTKLNRYTSIEGQQMMSAGKRFSLFRMLAAGFRGFQVRYLTQKGFLDGYRGFFLSVMMGFYRALAYIKLWEACEFQEEPVSRRYQKLKEDLLKEYR